MKYFKFFNDDDNHKGFQYKDGLNTDTMPFNDDPDDDWGEGGLYFGDESNIMDFLGYGNFIREVSVPKGVKHLKFYDSYRAEGLFLNPRHDLREVSTWVWLDAMGVFNKSSYNQALRWASRNGHLDVVKYLVERGADVTVWDNDPIRLSCAGGHLDVAKFLIEQGADFTAADNWAICYASENGHLEVVRFLIEQGGIAENIIIDAFSAACEGGYLEVVKYLDGLGVVIDYGDYPIRVASESGCLGVVKYLVEKGVDVTERDNYAVRVADENGHLDVVNYLLTEGASLD